jgi:hypothetical protein
MSAGLTLLAAALAILTWPGRPRRLGRSAPAQATPALLPALPIDLLLELIAAALASGLPAVAAVAEVFAALGQPQPPALAAALAAPSRGGDPQRAWALAGAEFEPLAQALTLAECTGAAAGPLLREFAAAARLDRSRQAKIAARKLGVQLALPLAVTILPAFFLLGIMPIVLGLARGFSES